MKVMKKRMCLIIINRDIKAILKRKFLLLLFLFSTLAGNSAFVFGAPTIKSSAPPIYEWQEMTYNYNLFREWDGEPVVSNYSGSYSDHFIKHFGYYNETTDTYIKETRTVDYLANYSLFSNTTYLGNITIDMALDVFLVNLDYENSINLTWVALKQGSLSMEHFTRSYEEDFSYYEQYNQDISSSFVEYNRTTWEVLNTWTRDYDDSGEINMTRDDEPQDTLVRYTYDMEFSMPLILTMQLFTTKNKDRVAWAELFNDFIVFKDKDNDGIYSAGKKGASSNKLQLTVSDEYVGGIHPLAWDSTLDYEMIDYSGLYGNNTINLHYTTPNDTAVSTIADSIAFTPPAMDENGIVSWDILYPNYPTVARIDDRDKPMKEWYDNDFNSSLSDLSPTNYNYEFDYNISEDTANLDYTFEMSKISDPEFYNAAQGYGLCLPHYNYFISSFDINEVDQKDLTVPSDLFTFESNGTTVAEINLINPIKKNYTLYDFPDLGVDTELESFGGSIHRLLMEREEANSNADNPFINLIYSLRDIVQADPTFTVDDDLYRVETVNYPLWNGEHLIHDPTFTIHYAPQTTPEEPPIEPPVEPPLIPGFSPYFIICSLAVGIIIIIKRCKLKGEIPT
jgi:hypothetical protein